MHNGYRFLASHDYDTFWHSSHNLRNSTTYSANKIAAEFYGPSSFPCALPAESHRLDATQLVDMAEVDLIVPPPPHLPCALEVPIAYAVAPLVGKPFTYRFHLPLSSSPCSSQCIISLLQTLKPASPSGAPCLMLHTYLLACFWF